MNLFKAGVTIVGTTEDPSIQAIDGAFAVVAQSADGALPLQGFCPVTKAGVAVLTLGTPATALPSASGNDGQTVTVFDTTGHAHTITTASNKINGSSHVITFNGGSPVAAAIGSFVKLVAYNGVWWVTSQSNVTLS